MEEGSLEEDSSLRDFWKKKERKKEKQGRKKRKAESQRIHERCLEGQRDHRLCRGLLSRAREEREAEILEAKITVLSEDNELLRSQHDELARTNNENKDQIAKIMSEKAAWQDKLMQLMAKRPRDRDSEPGSSKRVVEERSNSAPGTPTDIEKITVDEGPDTSSTSPIRCSPQTAARTRQETPIQTNTSG